MRRLAVAVVLVLLTAPMASAQIGNPAGMKPGTPQKEPGQPAPNQPNTQDRLFMYLVGSGGMAEVSSGRSAQKKAQNSTVKDFARRMAQDHAKANEQLASLAKAAGVALPGALHPDHTAAQAELDRLSGPAFDLAYMRQQLVEHQKTATLLQWEIGSGQDAELQRFAARTLPVVLEHLERAQDLIAQLTGAGSQGLAAAPASEPSASPGSTPRGGSTR